MTEGFPEDEDGLILKGIYQKITPVLSDEEERAFKPWHKPRKHYLRVHQWCAMLRRLIGELSYGEGDTIHYLGLPGEDFLDIRTLEGVCDRAKVSLRYLGFDSSADTGGEYEMLLSKHEISALSFVDPFSVLARDSVEKLASDTSIAREIFQRVGPFDVINLDICDSVLSSVGSGSYFDTLSQLCDLQLRCGRVTPWLVFLSTRAVRSQLEATAKKKLLQCILGNLEGSASFGELLSKKLALEATAIRKELKNEELLEHPALVTALGVGLGKWLLKLTMSANPKVTVRLLQSYSYRVETAHPDMLSLAFKFEPIIESRRDASRLAASAKKTTNVTEIELASELIESVASIQDVDQLLADNTQLFQRVLRQSGEILASARYDIDAYRRWVASSTTFGRAGHPDGGKVPPKR